MDRIITGRYARALFDIALEKNCLQSYSENAALMADTIENTPELGKILLDPGISNEQKLEILKKSFEGAEDDIFGLFAVLFKKNRQTELTGVLRHFCELVREHEGITVATVESAVELDNDRLEKIRKSLSDNLNKRVETDARVLPELIGGIRISVDGHLIDSSILKQLENLRKELSGSTPA